MIVIEDSTDKSGDMMCNLLKSMSAAVIITPDQMHKVSC